MWNAESKLKGEGFEGMLHTAVPLDPLPAVHFADVAGSDVGIVLEEYQILAVDRLAHERAFERQRIHRIEVVAHDPRLVDVRRRRDQVGGEDRRPSA